jgi:hypothetical protein
MTKARGALEGIALVEVRRAVRWSEGNRPGRHRRKKKGSGRKRPKRDERKRKGPIEKYLGSGDLVMRESVLLRA